MLCGTGAPGPQTACSSAERDWQPTEGTGENHEAPCTSQATRDRERSEVTYLLSVLLHFNFIIWFCSFRIYQQQLDIEKAQQLKRPTEDLEVRESSSLPSLPEMGWVRLPSQAFADLLMVVEFGQSFVEFLELEPAPMLSDMYLALYNFKGGKIMLELCAQLLKAVLYDPSEYVYLCVCANKHALKFASCIPIVHSVCMCTCNGS